ncbi:MAG: M20/M25/M40 family metallo-hydrolase [Candidatus Gastranaerophilales bacterium]
MDINKIRKEYELIDLFCNLAEIPSPSLGEEKVAFWIKKYCDDNKMICEFDDYQNVYIEIPATDSEKQSLLLSAHMDVIGDASEVVTYLDGDLIRAKGRTLGADDKAGIASALLLAKNIQNSDFSHGGIELVFTRDEESGMSGIRHVNFSKINSKYILVCDSDSLGQLEVSGASYTQVKIEVNSFKGGHSGIDIADTTRENAAKLIADIVSDLPQGVYHSQDGSVITSCNLGGIISGDVAVTNIINTNAKASYSIRSADKALEEELKSKMSVVISDFNKQYAGVAQASIVFEQHLPAFEKVDDDFIPTIFEKVAKVVGVKEDISSFHAGAETHIYANQKNSNGEGFAPYLIGLADICNMHSREENVDYKSMLKGYELLQEFFKAYNS